jgi:hypothetical protein
MAGEMWVGVGVGIAGLVAVGPRPQLVDADVNTACPSPSPSCLGSPSVSREADGRTVLARIDSGRAMSRPVKSWGALRTERG